jgi:drug/metabolite transporter (DMT)-like permease
MSYLFLVSLIWGFSFGIIKHSLSGIDSSFIAFARLFISLLVFIPFLNLKPVKPQLFLKLLLIGSLQFGVMYLCYIEAFRYLAAYEVALYTVFTPLYVVMFYNLITREANPLFFFSALLAVLGSVVIHYRSVQLPDNYLGFLLVQLSNLSFAAGQVGYKLLKLEESGIKQHRVFGILYLGGLFVAALSLLGKGNIPVLTVRHFVSLLYLGILPSAVCFFLWNYGARITNTGILSVFNNLKIPVAIIISLLFFGEQGDPLTLAAGSIILLIALLINRYRLLGSKLPLRKEQTEN